VNREEIARLLEACRLQVTAQRLEIAEFILAKPQHLSAEQILSGMRDLGSSVSKATVYNTLNSLSAHGIIRTVQVDPERQYYDSTSRRHHHFYNVDTGELIDIPEGAVALEVNTALPAGTEHDGVDVVVRVRSTRIETV
jgi:Fur family transcriptional regulator, iron response regulator